MIQLTKKQMQEYIDKIIEFIDNGVISVDNRIFYGHPGFYFFHTKKELYEKINLCLNKELYDKYDLYYITNYLIKYMLDKYDSHTKISFKNNLLLPIKFKIENNKVYIIDHSSDLANIIGSEVISINNIKIDKILSEIENITCYSTKEFLKVNQENSLCNSNVLKSLPSIDSTTKTINLCVLHDNKIKNVNIKIDNNLKEINDKKPKNYSYEIINDIIIIHYNSCNDMNKMVEMINEITKLSKNLSINNYIIDLRGNNGGDSRVNVPLIEFSKNKNIVVLINEFVFSSGRMAFVDLKKIGAYAIGTDISTSLNCFGNIPGSLNIDELGLIVRRSSTYWFYDNNYNCKGYNKDNFSNYFNSKRELLEPILLHPDEYAYLTISDIINGKDTQLEAAINFFKKYNKLK